MITTILIGTNSVVILSLIKGSLRYFLNVCFQHIIKLDALR
jgi:hypothetical protein